MEASSPAFESAYRLLKRDILHGRFPPRALLVESGLAREFEVSITPIRNAAFRLVGEMLLESHPLGGFQIPNVTEAALADLYFWHGQLLRNALHGGRWRPCSASELRIEQCCDLATPLGLADAAVVLFQAIADGARNSEHRIAILAAGERLHRIRVIEPVVMGGIAEELLAVQRLTADGAKSELIQTLWAYHRRRLRRVRALMFVAGGRDSAISC